MTRSGPAPQLRPTYFVGVAAPAHLSTQILRWQAELGHVITAPHVTLKAPGAWRGEQIVACREACRRTPPFTVRVGGVQSFGERVVFLAASGPGLHVLHTALVRATGDPPGPFELDHYHPHLTLALGWRPTVQVGWDRVLARAQAEFAALERQPLEFEVRQALLYRKDKPGEPYHQAAAWALEG